MINTLDDLLLGNSISHFAHFGVPDFWQILCRNLGDICCGLSRGENKCHFTNIQLKIV